MSAMASGVFAVSRPQRSEGVSAALAAFVSAVLSVVLTIAGTLVGLSSDASKSAVFLVLTWVLIVTSIATGGAALWLLADSVRKQVRALAHLRELDAYVPQLIRFRRRHDTFVIDSGGDASVQMACEVESPEAAVVPWLLFTMIAEVPEDRPEWSSIVVRRVCVDGVESDPAVAFVKRHRQILVDSSSINGRAVEVGAVRVPVSLGMGRTRCSFEVELDLIGAFAFIDREEKCYTDVLHVTDELRVTIKGKDGLRVSCSPYSHYRVQASHLGMEMPDLPESQLQSAYCQSVDGVRWTTGNAKLGYRYAIAVRGQG